MSLASLQLKHVFDRWIPDWSATSQRVDFDLLHQERGSVRDKNKMTRVKQRIACHHSSKVLLLLLLLLVEEPLESHETPPERDGGRVRP